MLVRMLALDFDLLRFRGYGTETPRLWIEAENDYTKYTTKSSVLLHSRLRRAKNILS